MIAASRRWAKVRPWQVFSRADSSPLVNTATSFSVTFGARSRAIGSGRSSSAASHLKNCCSARLWEGVPWAPRQRLVCRAVGSGWYAGRMWQRAAFGGSD